MSRVSALSARYLHSRIKGYAIAGLVAAAAIVAMALDTKVVKLGSETAADVQGFSAQTYGPKMFPVIRQDIEARAVDAVLLAQALRADKQAALKKYGVGDALPIVAVRFEGRMGDEKSGIFTVNVDGLPPDVKVRLQTGPVLTGTELRDATGKIAFGDFTNQIEYQNAAMSINQALKTALLDKLDRSALTGKQVSVVGAFRMLNPNNWLVIPVSLEVK